jgi:hypothetical protein
LRASVSDDPAKTAAAAGDQNDFSTVHGIVPSMITESKSSGLRGDTQQQINVQNGRRLIRA